MPLARYIGWDIGGAHLKFACLDGRGRLVSAEQYATPLWTGLDGLGRAFAKHKRKERGGAALHAVTMTGELVDIFPDRRTGISSLLDIFEEHFPGDKIAVYGINGFLTARQARRRWLKAASANWHATAACTARFLRDGLLVDIGSTTTDIIPLRAGSPDNRGSTDQERLQSDELVYTGIVRTPVMAVVQRVPFSGEWQNVAADFFATMADIYRIVGDLPEQHDQMETADGAGKRVSDSCRRLLRMVGRDMTGTRAELLACRHLAGHIASVQLNRIEQSCGRILSSHGYPGKATLVGAGSGRFVARRLASRLGHAYIDFGELLDIDPPLRDAAAVCASAVSVARLAVAETGK
jgi:probable H4MPT-linked C1 transfer pathway protein